MANPVEMDDSLSPQTLDLHAMNSSVVLSQSYFAYPEGSGLLTAHIILMVIAWFFILPTGKIIIAYLRQSSRPNAADHDSQKSCSASPDPVMCCRPSFLS